MIKVTLKVPPGMGVIPEATINRALSAVAEFARDRIATLANQRLPPKLAQAYTQALHQPDSVRLSKNHAVLTLVDGPNGLATKAEQGMPLWSIRDALLKGPVAQEKGYVDVPFRHSVPGTKGHAAPAMPKSDFNAMRVAVKKAQRAAMSGGMSRSAAMNIAVRGPVTMPTGPKADHKVSLYSSMKRIVSTAGRTRSAVYMTWRRVSKKTSPTAWRHPGTKGLNLFDEVAPTVLETAQEVVSTYILAGVK